MSNYDLLKPQRATGESFAKYKARRKACAAALAKHAEGELLHASIGFKVVPGVGKDKEVDAAIAKGLVRIDSVHVLKGGDEMRVIMDAKGVTYRKPITLVRHA